MVCSKLPTTEFYEKSAEPATAVRTQLACEIAEARQQNEKESASPWAQLLNAMVVRREKLTQPGAIRGNLKADKSGLTYRVIGS
jgi:hypothetical protein